MTPSRRQLRVAVAGLGAVGMALAETLWRGIPGCALAAVSASSPARAGERLAAHGIAVAAVPSGALEPLADLLVECAPAAALPAVAAPFLRAGKTVLVLSASALLADNGLVELARAHGGQIIVPTGALLGLDAVTAAAEGTIRSVRMTTRKPIRGLRGAPHLLRHGIDIDAITAPLCVFSGTAREAAAGFPANLNVAVALSLAGIGPDRTELAIWADPSVGRNIHSIEVDADSARFSMTIENVPSDNPRTGRITALSVIAALRKLQAPLRVGT
jgi:aspartate dehydrogenase